MTTSDTRRAQGFTLIEVIVVLAIMTLLIGAALPLTSSLIDRDRESEVNGELCAIAQALEDYYFDHGAFPATLTDAAFLNVYLQGGVNGTAVRDSWGGNVDYLFSRTGNPDTATAYSRGSNGLDDGVGVETLKIVVNGSVAGNRKTRDRMRVIVEALGNFLEGGGTLTGTWNTDRANMGLGVEYANDGFGTPFSLSAASYVLRSAGADRTMNSADDLTS
jgi:general secretion pathway protein G